MKKLLLATAIAAVASSSFAAENDFYVRADVGAAFLPKANSKNGLSGKRNSHVVADLGAGTYLMDNVRTEVTIGNYFNAKQNFKGTNGTAHRKVKNWNVTLKGLVDVFDSGYGKVFLGAGVGYTQLSAKSTFTPSPAGTAAGLVVNNSKAKKKNNVSFLATAGFSVDVSEGVMLDIAYAYNDHGKTKALLDANKVNYGTVHFKSHNVTAGLRVDL